MADTQDTDELSTDAAAADTASTAAASPVTAEGAVLTAEPIPAGSPKDLFAALMAKASDEVKDIARERGTLLGLHTVASAQADVTGDYKAGDLNK